ncbi:hypothetical protein STXM2123_899 [Streptomyces sp. F-3]|nr:hypothetical protein STXM2123_899 [Streptomyces sp. F-3]
MLVVTVTVEPLELTVIPGSAAAGPAARPAVSAAAATATEPERRSD